MKTISLFITLFIVIITNLSARENPFEPTQTYETEFARLMEIEEDYPYEFQEKEDQEEHSSTKVAKEKKTAEIVKKASKKKLKKVEVKVVQKVKPKVVKKAEAKAVQKVKPKVVKKAEAKAVRKTKTMPMKKMALTEPVIIEEVRVSLDSEKMLEEREKANTISLENAMTDLNEEKIEVKVPKRKDIVIHENIDILPFLNIDYTNDIMKVSSKYNVFRKFTIEKSNKIVLDFHAKTFFLTKNQESPTEYFEKVVVGNHLKDKYFRVVIVLKHTPSKYKVTYTNNLVTVEFDKDMI